ncbi:hypothetical protein AVEN_259911-1 [Araneus ventricosus]|uniref:Uncharacterized protein n=1 Tax=Araneus ventricosus TaxID=182803 RepID=A0A4Y2IYQ8_ARAVE|nr:hypothetical protein AVEN_259911-1 [Araneus ventricosus]
MLSIVFGVWDAETRKRISETELECSVSISPVVPLFPKMIKDISSVKILSRGNLKDRPDTGEEENNEELENCPTVPQVGTKAEKRLRHFSHLWHPTFSFHPETRRSPNHFLERLSSLFPSGYDVVKLYHSFRNTRGIKEKTATVIWLPSMLGEDQEAISGITLIERCSRATDGYAR